MSARLSPLLVCFERCPANGGAAGLRPERLADRLVSCIAVIYPGTRRSPCSVLSMTDRRNYLAKMSEMMCRALECTATPHSRLFNTGTCDFRQRMQRRDMHSSVHCLGSMPEGCECLTTDDGVQESHREHLTRDDHMHVLRLCSTFLQTAATSLLSYVSDTIGYPELITQHLSDA